jgi:hypothetical protein
MRTFSLGIAAIACLLFAGTVECQDWTITSDSIPRSELIEILVVGERTDLAEIGPAAKREKQLLMKLYGVAREGPCVPETHYVCSFDYYLAVSEFGYYPDQAAFRIGRWGEVRGVEWLPRQADDEYGTARLRLQVANYPAAVLPYNSELQEEVRTVDLLVSVARVVPL